MTGRRLFNLAVLAVLFCLMVASWAAFAITLYQCCGGIIWQI